MASENGIAHLTSARPVSEVLKQLLSILHEKQITLFAVVDHSGEAAKAGMQMPDTKLVVFGNPKAGTPLMIASLLAVWLSWVDTVMQRMRSRQGGTAL